MVAKKPPAHPLERLPAVSSGWTEVRKIKKKLNGGFSTAEVARPRICDLFVRYHDIILEELQVTGRGRFTMDEDCLETFNALVNDLSEQLVAIARRESQSRASLWIQDIDVEKALRKICGSEGQLAQMCLNAIKGEIERDHQSPA